MSSRTYTMPNTDDEVRCEYKYHRNGDVELAEVSNSDGHVFDQAWLDNTYIKTFVRSGENRFLRDEKFISLTQYFQEKLEGDYVDIAQEEADSYDYAPE